MLRSETKDLKEKRPETEWRERNEISNKPQVYTDANRREPGLERERNGEGNERWEKEMDSIYGVLAIFVFFFFLERLYIIIDIEDLKEFIIRKKKMKKG